jgi:hypothetical protein
MHSLSAGYFNTFIHNPMRTLGVIGYIIAKSEAGRHVWYDEHVLEKRNALL